MFLLLVSDVFANLSSPLFLHHSLFSFQSHPPSSFQYPKAHDLTCGSKDDQEGPDDDVNEVRNTARGVSFRINCGATDVGDVIGDVVKETDDGC